MKLGQIPENVYNRSVSKEIKYKSDMIIGGAASGEVCASFVTDKGRIISSLAKTASLKELGGRLAVYSAVNEILARGARPLMLNINLIMPHRFAEEKLKLIVREFDELSKKLQVAIGSFTGEMINPLSEAVVSVVCEGIDESEAPVWGSDIVMTGCAGLAATVILAKEKRDELQKRFSEAYIDDASFSEELLSVKNQIDALNSYCDNNYAIMALSKGGVYKTLWKLGQAADSGLEVELKSIPIRQETIELANFFDLNPYELNSEGALLIACSDGDGLVDYLNGRGFEANVIGHLTDNNDRVIVNDYERKFLTKPCPDEMTKIDL